jgi:hypothetical protein
MDRRDFLKGAGAGALLFQLNPLLLFRKQRLAITKVTSNAVYFTWIKSMGIAGFEYRYKLHASPTWGAPIDLGNALQGAITGLTGGTSIDIEVREYDFFGVRGAWSDIATGTTLKHVNFARAVMGATFSASSTLDIGASPQNAFNDWWRAAGVYNGTNAGGTAPIGYGNAWGANGFTGSEWLEADLGQDRTIDFIRLVFIADNFASDTYLTPASDPDLTTTGTLAVMTSFKVQYWDGSTWVDIAATVTTGNTHVRKEFTLVTPITAQKFRVYFPSAGQNGSAAVVAFELFGNGTVDLSQTNYIIMGDSRSAGAPGIGYTVSWPKVFAADLGLAYAERVDAQALEAGPITLGSAVTNLAISGYLMEWLNDGFGNHTWKVQPHINPLAGSNRVVLWAETNDIGASGRTGAQIYADQLAFIAKERTNFHLAPEEIWLATPSPAIGYGSNTERANLLTLQLANTAGADKLVRMDAIPGTPRSMDNPADGAPKWYTDGIHPLNTGGSNWAKAPYFEASV